MDEHAHAVAHVVDASIESETPNNAVEKAAVSATVEGERAHVVEHARAGSQLVTTAGLAAAIGLSPSHLRRLAAAGALPVARVEAGVRYFDPVTVVEKLQVTRTTMTRTIAPVEQRAARDNHDEQEIEALSRLGDGEDPIDVARELRIPPKRIEAIYACYRRMKAARREEEDAARAIETRHRAAAAAQVDARRAVAEEHATKSRRPRSPSTIGKTSKLGPTRAPDADVGSPRWHVERWADEGGIDPHHHQAVEYVDDDAVGALAKKLCIGREKAAEMILTWRRENCRNVRLFPVESDLWFAAVAHGGESMIEHCAPVLAEARGIEVDEARETIRKRCAQSQSP